MGLLKTVHRTICHQRFNGTFERRMVQRTWNKKLLAISVSSELGKVVYVCLEHIKSLLRIMLVGFFVVFNYIISHI